MVCRSRPCRLVLQRDFGHVIHRLGNGSTQDIQAGLLLDIGVLVLGADVQDSVSVDAKGHFDARLPARRGGETLENQRAQSLVLAKASVLASTTLNRYSRLIVMRGGKHALALDR